MKKCEKNFCEIDEKRDNDVEKADFTGDYGNLLLLFVLYILQGVPQGLSGAIPILLHNRGVSYTDQAIFSITFFPFAIKVLYAPIIDSIYCKAFGRRKTWICSSQLTIGFFLICSAFKIEKWLGDGDNNKPEIVILTTVFLLFWFLTSVQEIAIDGWCLTILKPKNTPYAATCNSVGHSAGKIIGFIVFLIFESKEFCNQYIFSEPQDTGVFTISGFLLFWGIVYVIITTFVALFKKEEDPDINTQLEEHEDYGITKAYRVLLKILKLKPAIKFYTILFSVEAAFAASYAVTPLKLIENGVPKEKYALLSIPTTPIQILFPLFITKYTTGQKPLSFYHQLFLYRMIVAIIFAVFVYITPAMLKLSSIYFYLCLIVIIMFQQILIRATCTAESSFLMKVADPLVGGTYVTLMNTLGNLGTRVFNTITLWLVDKITYQKCDIVSESFNCTSTHQLTSCETCTTLIDGYFIEIILSVVYGILWFIISKSVINQLQNYPKHDWFVLSKSAKNQELLSLA